MKNKKSKIKKVRWQPILVAVSIAAAAVLVAAVFGIYGKSGDKAVVESLPEAQMERRLIDGVFVLPAEVDPPLVGVMIENMIEAQPISGIADATLVFEAVTEANITRFLGYFVLNEINEIYGGPSSGRPEDGLRFIEIGPVRSARPYYLDWAAEFNSLYAHIGSSPAAYELLRKKGVEGVQDFDQWYNPQYFYSKARRPKPHHLYTSTELLGEAYEADMEHGTWNMEHKLDPWKFKNDAAADLRGDVNEIIAGYAAPYDVRWAYDKLENQYKRIQWGGEHRDAQGRAIIAKNIAVAFQKMKILDEVGRKEFTTLGEGKGLVFQDGRVVVGVWKKLSARERMRWYDAQGSEVEFNAGVTWIEIVPENFGVRY